MAYYGDGSFFINFIYVWIKWNLFLTTLEVEMLKL